MVPTGPRRRRTATLVAFSFIAFVALACVSPGERASDAAVCDALRCSSATPMGLQFSSSDPAAPGSRPVGLTASNGSHRIRVIDRQTRSDLVRPFTATAGGGAFAVATTSPPFVTIAGGAGSGNDFLSITDSDTGELFDRIRLGVVPVERASVAVTSELGPVPLLNLQVGGSASFSVTLLNGETAIVDHSATAASSDASIVAVASSNSELAIARALATGSADLRVVSGGASFFAASLNVVTGVDEFFDLAPGREDGFANTRSFIPHRETTVLCFQAFIRNASVIGVRWQFATPDTATVTLRPSVPANNCVSVNPQTVDAFDLVVTAESIMHRYTIHVAAQR